MANVPAEVLEQPSKPPRPKSPSMAAPGRVLDFVIVAAFLGLAFLLGLFPLKDTDFWWHLREGDEIRKTWQFPVTDTFTFGAEGRPWIDLHWTFQVLLSWGYQLGGVPLLTLAKCVVTCAALLLLITARKKDWPLEVMLVAWIPALVVLGGRMYVRPETISLLYLCGYLAVLFRLDQRSKLAYVLPLIQVLWVNVQGLFILGPVVLSFYLLGSALSPGAFEKARKPWWRTVLTATVAVGVACLFNPYALSGALYPLQLAATMGNPIFSRTIGELQPIPDFIAKAGLNNLPLQFHLATAALGLLSFVLPAIWFLWTKAVGPASAAAEPTETSKKKSKVKAPSKPKRAKKSNPGAGLAMPIFRLLLFASFTVLSLKATRNSHQFAAVVGTVTAWNLGEWGAAIQRRREAANRGPLVPPAVGKMLALGLILGMVVLVGSGRLYDWMGEGRTIGIDEEPLWFPHEAIKAAGRPGMPDRSICYHNGHASLYEYVYAPDRKTYADARLEVVGPQIYQEYIDLETRIRTNAPTWQRELRAMKLPVIVADNVQAVSGALHATMITANDWHCVWFDPVAALYVHETYAEAVARDRVDFLGRHFGRFVESEPGDPLRHIMQSKAYWNIVYALLPKPGENPRPSWREAMRPLIAIGQSHARQVRKLSPEAFEGWKYDGLLEFFREMPDNSASSRFRMPFDPVLDLSSIRATYALKRAQALSPTDGNILATLIGLFQQRGMNDEAITVLDEFLSRPANGPEQRTSQARAEAQRGQIRAALGSPPSLNWKNFDELAQTLNICLTQGRAETVAGLYEKAYPIEARPWEITDRIATLRLHLGQPEVARKLWLDARDAPSPAIQRSRAAMASLAMADFVGAIEGFEAAIAAEPKLFEALYGLAVAQFDAGNAPAALSAAERAMAASTDPSARSAASTIADLARPYAKPSTAPVR